MAPDLVLQPSLLRMFYEQATSKDYFTMALGGPGYMYPRAVGDKVVLNDRLKEVERAMKRLDLGFHFLRSLKRV